MNSDLDKFISERFSHCRRSKGIQAIVDENENVVFDDDLHELYRMGQRSRDNELLKLTTIVNAQQKQLDRKQSINFTFPWWIGLLLGLVAVAYFYFNFIYVRP